MIGVCLDCVSQSPLLRALTHLEHFMKIKTQNLIGKALDFAVAKCEGKSLSYESEILTVDVLDLKHGVAHSRVAFYRPSSNWRQGGPIIEREDITVVCAEGDYSPELLGYETYWVAEKGKKLAHFVHAVLSDDYGTYFLIEDFCCIKGSTPLEAAMRCYVASKLGDEVEVPDELL